MKAEDDLNRHSDAEVDKEHLDLLFSEDYLPFYPENKREIPMQQKIKVAHASTPLGLQKALDELTKQYETWTIIKMDLSSSLSGDLTAIVLMEKRV